MPPTLKSPLWLIGLFCAVLALGTDEFVIAGLLPDIESDLEVSAGTAGQLITAFAIAFAVGAPVMGATFDAFPRRTVVLAGLTVFVAANLAAAMAPGFGVLLAVRIIAGLAAAVVSTTSFAAAAQGASDERRGRYLATVTAGLTVALFTGVPFGAWVGSLWGWRSTFVLIAVVATVAASVLTWRLPPLPGAPPSSLTDRLRPLSSRPVLRLVVSVTLCGSGGLMFYSYISPITLHLAGNTAELPVILLIVGVIGVPSAIVGGWLADTFGGRTARLTVILGHATTLLIIAVLVFAQAPVWMFMISVGGWSVFAWALNPPLQASTIDAAPTAPMTAISLNISGLYLGTAIGAALGGLITDSIGAPWVPLVAAGLLLAAAASASFRPTITTGQ